MSDKDWYIRWQKSCEASNYFDWIVNEVELYRGAEEGHQTKLRLRKGAAKRLVDELYPIGQFAKNYFRGNRSVTIEWVGGKQNFDARVYGDTSLKFLEITTSSHVPDNEYIHAIMLRDGFYINNSSIDRESTKHYRKSRNPDDLICNSSRVLRNPSINLEAEVENVVRVAEQKVAKDYPAKTALIIVFDDSFSVIPDNRRLEQFISLFLSKAPSTLAQFSLVTLSGLAGKHYIHFKPKDFSQVDKLSS